MSRGMIITSWLKGIIFFFLLIYTDKVVRSLPTKTPYSQKQRNFIVIDETH